MATQTPPGEPGMTREERLAAKLRENLRRRKAQARAVSGILQDQPENGPQNDSAPGGDGGSVAGESGESLPKPPPTG